MAFRQASRPLLYDEVVSNLNHVYFWDRRSELTTTEEGEEKSELESEIITIEVGKEKRLFHVHKDVLSKYDYFRKCLAAGHFTEATKKKITLPEDDPTLFAKILDFIYFNRVPYQVPHGTFAQIDKLGSWEALPNEDEVDQILLKSLKTYTLADKFCIEPLMNAILNDYRKYFEMMMLPLPHLLYVTEHEPQHSKLRIWSLRALAYQIRQNGFKAHKLHQKDTWTNFIELNMENAVAVLKELAIHHYDGTEEELFHHWDECRWHVHRETPRCDGENPWTIWDADVGDD